MSLPIIIQGGMGVGVSNWRLARAVSQLGQLGVVSGALIAVVLARRLQAGDEDGRMRHALAHFPFPAVAERVLEAHFREKGTPEGTAFTACAMPRHDMGRSLAELTIVASFAEVFLAKEGHEGPVGINLLEKIQIATLPSLYGAMLADVDFVLMGAGIPRSIPGVLDRFAEGQAASLRIDVEGALPGEELLSSLDPSHFSDGAPVPLKRPRFLAIVSSSTLALSLARKSNGKVDGFVIEAETAGGHNAPPRGQLRLSAKGEPVYGPRDVPDFAVFRELGLPFWLAGGRATAEGLRDARACGASGIQVGTAFAFCTDSGLRDDLRQKVAALVDRGQATVFTDPLASPTGFPFKVVQVEDSLSESDAYEARRRVCDLGYLRQAYRKADGSIGYRCAAEPVDDFVKKGGSLEATVGRKCLCNGLAASVGLAQRRGEEGPERDLVTAGDDLANLARYRRDGASSYSAADVIDCLLREPAGDGTS